MNYFRSREPAIRYIFCSEPQNKRMPLLSGLGFRLIRGNDIRKNKRQKKKFLLKDNTQHYKNKNTIINYQLSISIIN